VALTLVDDATIAMLNKTHMGKRGPTDVLSFPLLDPHEYPARSGVRRAARPRRRVVRVPQAGASVPLGDIVISVDRAIEQAREGRGGTNGQTRHSVADEVRLLAVHGALHLCGWDHATATSQAAMWREQERILRAHTAAMKRAAATKK
jgi:probable rRNA maturation factor